MLICSIALKIIFLRAPWSFLEVLKQNLMLLLKPTPRDTVFVAYLWLNPDGIPLNASLHDILISDHWHYAWLQSFSLQQIVDVCPIMHADRGQTLYWIHEEMDAWKEMVAVKGGKLPCLVQHRFSTYFVGAR